MPGRAGILLLTIVAVEYGGTFMLRVVRGRVPLTPFQRAFVRAGQAHAGVLVIAALICQVLADSADLTGLPATLGAERRPACRGPVPGRLRCQTSSRRDPRSMVQPPGGEVN